MADSQPFVAQLARWEDEDLRIAAEHVQQLADHPGFQALERVLGEVHENAMTRLIGGGAAGRPLEQAEYARLVGFLAGMSQPTAALEAFALAESKRQKRNNPEGDTP